MNWLTTQFTKAAALYKDKNNPWWRRGFWAVFFFVLGAVVLFRIIYNKKRIAALEADVEIYQQKALTGRELAKANALVLQADKQHVRADKFEAKAKKAEVKWGKAVDAYGESRAAIDNAKDWDTLTEVYDDLD